MGKFYVYFLESEKNHKIYVGSTSKLPEDRLKEHNIGTNAWTKINKPFKLIYFEEYGCLKCAKSREHFYKTGFGRHIKDIIIENIKYIKPK